MEFDKFDLTKYNKDEVADVRLININDANLVGMNLSSIEFTPWFWQCLAKIKIHLNSHH